MKWKRIDVEAALEEVGSPCECTSWSLSGSCGDSGCEDERLPYTRTCSDDCDIEFKCEYDESCVEEEDPEEEFSDCEESGYEFCIEYSYGDCDVSVAINDYSENYIRWGEVVDSSDPYVIGNYTVGWKGLGVEDVYYDVDDPNSDCDYDSGGCDTGDDIDNTGTMVVINAPGIADREEILGYDDTESA